MSNHTEHQVPRATAVVGLASVALIHVLELQDKLKETPYLGIGYILLIVACVIAGALLLHSNDRRGWILGGGAAWATLVGYSITRTVGLPQSMGDLGTWLEPMGLASIFLEAIVTGVAVYALSTMRTSVKAHVGEQRHLVAA